MNNYDYPLGADNDSAPWNEVTVIAEGTITVTVTVPVDDDASCSRGEDEDEIKKAFAERAYKSPSDLIDMLRKGRTDDVIDYLSGLDAEVTDTDINLK